MNLRNIYRDLKCKKLSQDKIDKVKEFLINYPDFRLPHECAKVTNMDIDEVKLITYYLYRKRIIGAYVFDEGHPNRFMLSSILKKFPEINGDSNILEIGPGRYPVFHISEYKNWYGIDKNLDSSGVIRFRENNWTNSNSYVSDRILNGGWENISDVTNKIGMTGQFDLVVASHSYEHVFKPIRSLIEASKALKPNGIIVLFVPNGFSDDGAFRQEMTHTLFLVPDMIEEFFTYSNCYKNLVIEDFRPNFDFIASARAK